MVAAWQVEAVVIIGYCGNAPDLAFNWIKANLVLGAATRRLPCSVSGRGSR